VSVSAAEVVELVAETLGVPPEVASRRPGVGRPSDRASIFRAVAASLLRRHLALPWAEVAEEIGLATAESATKAAARCRRRCAAGEDVSVRVGGRRSVRPLRDVVLVLDAELDRRRRRGKGAA